MAITANTKQQTYDYVPLTERGVADAFSVTIRRLTPKEFSFIEDKLAKMNPDQSISFTSGTYNWDIVKKGIIGWDNMVTETNKPIKIVIGSDGVVDDSLNKIPADIISEISGVIVGITKDPDSAALFLQLDEPVVEDVEQDAAKEATPAKKG
jgi:hypothetical protein